MGKTNKLLKNSSIYLVANFASKLLNVILVPIYTAYVQTDDYGSVNLLLLFSGIIGIVFSLDVIDAAYRHLLDEDSDKTSIITNSYMIFFAGFILFAAVYFPIVIQLKVRYGILLGFHILLTNSQTLNQQLARGLKKNKIYASAGVLMCLLQGVSNIILIVCFHMGGVSILIAPLIAASITIVYVSVTTRMYCYINIRATNTNVVRQLLSYGAPVCIGIVLNWIIQNGGSYILTWISGGTTLAGVYVLASKFPTIVSGLAAIFNMAWQETAVEEYGSQGYCGYYNKVLANFGKVNLYASSIVLPIVSIYFLIGKTGEYGAAKMLVPVLLVGTFFSSLQSYLVSGYYVLKNTKGIYINSLVASLITICSCLCLIPHFMLYGLVCSIFLGQLSLLIVTYINVKKHISFRIDFRKFLVPFLIFACECVLYRFEGLLYVLIGVLLFVGVLLLNEKELIIKIKNRIAKK